MKKSVRNKSKVSIWLRIKNFHKNRPWQAAFIYPIIYLIIVQQVASVLFELNGSMGINIFFAFILIFSMLLTPIWVLLGLIISQNKLPALLSLFVGLLMILSS